MALGTGTPCLFALRDGALKYDAYAEDADGVIRGLVYAPFARYASEVHGLDAVVHRHLSPAGILDLLDELIPLYPVPEARLRDPQIERIRTAYEHAHAQDSVARLDERTLADF